MESEDREVRLHLVTFLAKVALHPPVCHSSLHGFCLLKCWRWHILPSPALRTVLIHFHQQIKKITGPNAEGLLKIHEGGGEFIAHKVVYKSAELKPI